MISILILIEYFCFILKGGEIDGMVLRDFFDVHKSRFHGEKD